MDYFLIKVGDIVESLQGRDLGVRYLIIDIDKKGYCSLINGKHRKIGNPKIKNSKHLSFVNNAQDLMTKLQGHITDSELYKLIQKYVKE